jgi:glycerophosphoryl diester phosphodiesterase
VLEWGYDIIIWFQQFSPALDTVFKAITSLGSEEAFLLLLPLVYWCVDKRLGARLGLLLLLSIYLNFALKDLFDQPRPSPDRVKVLAEEPSQGLPSGHAQIGVSIYGYLAAQTQRPRIWVLGALVIVAVGLSRIYLGVHFPGDVLVGWLVGLMLLGAFLWVAPEIELRLRAWTLVQKVALAVLLPLGLLAVYANEFSTQSMGAILGLSTGVVIEMKWVHFGAKGQLWLRGARFLAGFVILVVLWLGLGELFPAGMGTTALILRTIRYALVGMWTSLGAPWMFVRTGLAPRESEAWT